MFFFLPLEMSDTSMEEMEKKLSSLKLEQVSFLSPISSHFSIKRNIWADKLFDLIFKLLFLGFGRFFPHYLPPLKS